MLTAPLESQVKVYPRVGGGTAWDSSDDGNVLGRVYPRVGGGTRTYSRESERCQRSIPAWAGEPCLWRSDADQLLGRVYPRVGGGTTWRRRIHQTCATSWSIPAWAGEPVPMVYT